MESKPLVAVIMGSKSDWEVMQHCAAQLEELNVRKSLEYARQHLGI